MYGAVGDQRAEQSHCTVEGEERKGKEGKEEGKGKEREGHDVRWVVEFSKERKETKEGCGVRCGGHFQTTSHFTACSGNKNYPESTIYTGLRSK